MMMKISSSFLRMKIVIFGLSVSSAWGNGHATLWRGLLRALAKAGHHVTFFERDVPWYREHRDLEQGDGYKIVFYSSWKDVASTAERAMAAADVGIVTSFCPDAQQATELVCGASPRARCLFYDLDTPVTLSRVARGETVEYLPFGGLADFDLVLSYTGGGALEKLQSELGARRTAPLYGSVDLKTHGCGERLHPSFEGSDLSYLGTYAEDRQPKVEELFLAPAASLPEQQFLLGGPLYPPTMKATANVIRRSHIPPSQHPAFYGSSRLTLNVTRGAMAALGWCPSGRLFEAAACGAPIVSDEWEGLGDFFEIGREILVASNAADVVYALEGVRTDLELMAKRARERVLAEHTADKRARELVQLIITRSSGGPYEHKTPQTPQRAGAATCDRSEGRTSRA